ncbi:MAG TPA: hypothetical protein QGG47_10545 [Acidobacteriota bacterium]|nr:hypothetical protein [Acidobacteriota bacterium]
MAHETRALVKVIQEEQDGIRIMVNMRTGDKSAAIQAIKDVLSQLED